MSYKEHLSEYVPDFAKLMSDRCNEKELKYNDTWKHRPVEETPIYKDQSERFFDWFMMKLDIQRHGTEKINWVDVANEAMICWARQEEANRQPRLF